MKKNSQKHQPDHNNRNYLKKQLDKLINIYGINSAIAAIKNQKRIISEIICTEKIFTTYQEIIKQYSYKIADNKQMNILCENENHQGILVRTNRITSNSIEHLKNISDKNYAVAILDQITDNHNLGAIIRSAAAFGINDIIIPSNNSAIENSISTKIASGSMELINLIEVVNINNVISQLKKLGFWIIGLDGSTEKVLSSEMLKGKICVILGSEGSGMRQLIKKNCDDIVKIPISKDVESLNVSNAAAITFYEINRVK